MDINRDEEWRAIDDFPEYEVSDRGRVKSNITGKILSKRIQQGYDRVCLYRDGRPTDVQVHRLVGKAFIENPHNKKDINHINGNKLDNSVDNLEWCTRSENLKHAYATGLKKPSGCYPIKEIRVVETNRRYESVRACARDMKLDQAHITQCLAGQRQTHKGYHFEYT